MTDKVIDCGEILTIDDMGDIYAQLLEAMGEGEIVSFNCSNLKRIDTAGLQLICSYAKEVRSLGSKLSWNAPSQSFIESAKLLGLASEMNLDDNAK